MGASSGPGGGAPGAAPEATALQALGHELSFRRRITNVLLLGLGWCCTASALFIQVSNSTLAAVKIPGGGPAVSTLPTALFVIAAAASVLPGAISMKRFGRRPVVLAAAALGLAGAGLEVLSLFRAGFPLLVLGALLQGPAFSIGNQYRFMAAEFSPPHFKPRAVSIVVLCGVPAAAVGPEFARQALNALPPAGGFIVLVGIYALLIVTMLLVDWRSLARLEAHADAAAPAAAAAHSPVAAQTDVLVDVEGGGERDIRKDGAALGATAPPPAAANAAPPPAAAAGVTRPLLSYRQLLLNQDFVLPALICGGSFMGMAAIMAVTPPEMVAAMGPRESNVATWVVEAHIVAMYLPGILSADLIKLVGAPITAVAGCAVLLAGNAIYYGGSQRAIYFTGMVVIGLGWHFAYVAATTAVIGVFAREPRRRLVVQGATDTAVISLSGIAIATSAALNHRFGWTAFVSIYVCVHGGLLLVASWFAARAWLAKRRAPGAPGAALVSPAPAGKAV